jgi:DNA polymerase V
MIEVFYIDKSAKLELPLFSNAVSAGFPSPADDYIENHLDLNKYLIQHPSSTFYIKVTGDSMVEANIYCGDILIIDRSIKIQNNDVALVILNGSFTVKRLKIIGERILLVPENEKYKTVEVSKEMDFEVWGKVVWSIHKH